MRVVVEPLDVEHSGAEVRKCDTQGWVEAEYLLQDVVDLLGDCEVVPEVVRLFEEVAEGVVFARRLRPREAVGNQVEHDDSKRPDVAVSRGIRPVLCEEADTF